MKTLSYERLFGLFTFALVLGFVSPILTALIGAVSAWIVGLFFADQIIDFLNRLGVRTDGLSMWQIGAALGFIGGYLKTTVHSKE